MASPKIKKMLNFFFLTHIYAVTYFKASKILNSNNNNQNQQVLNYNALNPIANNNNNYMQALCFKYYSIKSKSATIGSGNQKEKS
jgi:hypothetical protein